MYGYTWASSVTTWRVVAKSSREVPRRMKSATNQRCLARWDRESRRRVRFALSEFVTSVASPSNPRFNRARRIFARRIEIAANERSSRRRRASHIGNASRLSSRASQESALAHRGCVDTNRPGNHPRILNVPPLARTISTISRSRKREQFGILTCDQNGYSKKIVLRLRATGSY